jgi:TolA-binding protein
MRCGETQSVRTGYRPPRKFSPGQTRSLGSGQWLRITIAIALFFAFVHTARAQSFQRGGTQFNAVRVVQLGPGKWFNAAVTEFYHHGEIAADGRNILVVAKDQLVPFRVLQLGPGDFCRLAIQTVKGQIEYEIFYGGDPPSGSPPAWTCRDGLLLETRHFKKCNLQHLDPLREAFESSAPFGADYVETVFHGENPFDLRREPFLSKYTGYLDISAPGKYGFITASQDASFLLIDDKQVASAPGRHGPLRFAFRDVRQDVQLTAGLHKFEYYHAAAGPDTIMAAYWEINPTDPKPAKPQVISAIAFHADRIARLPTGTLSLRTNKQAPDFTLRIAGDVPMPDSPPLVAVAFHNASPKPLLNQEKGQWDFGDGQTSSELNPVHVYLKPGLYTVKLSFRLSGKTAEIANRVEVEAPLLDAKDKLHELSDHLKLIDSYNRRTLNAASLYQLVLAYELKASQLSGRADDLKREIEQGPSDPNRKPDDEIEIARKKRLITSLLADSRQYIAQAVETGKAAFAANSAAKGNDDLMKIARHIAPIARCHLGDSPSALQIWQSAAEDVTNPALKAECQASAADILINDLVKPQDAKPLLDQAVAALGTAKSGQAASVLQRVLGDYCAATGDGKSARAAYTAAEQASSTRRNFIETTAWKGAHSRLAEDFIKTHQFDRAAEELDAWQRDYPAEKLNGYLTLLLARYWAERGKHAQSIAQSEQLQAVNPDSAYTDQILFLAAECELLRDRQDRAAATLHSIIKDYPGSPLVPAAQKKLAELEKK